MDLPWKFFHDAIFPSEEEVNRRKLKLEQKRREAERKEKVRREELERQMAFKNKDFKTPPVKAQELINSEEEILRRFRAVLAQTRRQPPPSSNFKSTTPVSVNFNKRY